jgi:hypothetical protein
VKQGAFVLLTLGLACGKTAAPDEHVRSTAPAPQLPRMLPDAATWQASLDAFEAGLTARDLGDHALAEMKFLEAARLRRPNGFALARAGLAARARGAELRANDLFREALVDLEEETHERPRPAIHVPLACWGVFYTSVELHWRDARYLEMRCHDGVSVVDARSGEEVERYRFSIGHPDGDHMTTDGASVVEAYREQGRVTVREHCGERRHGHHVL